MQVSVLVQIKQMAYIWLLVGNLVLALWAVALYALGRSSAGEFYYRVVVFLQVLVGLAVVTGIWLLLRGSGTTPGHLLYAFLNGFLALARIGWHGRMMQSGRKGLLWLALLAFAAVALAARALAWAPDISP